jgi:dihydrodiol dehydrogenase / D-xylose 1-dehydrogenase (NADP)
MIKWGIIGAGWISDKFASDFRVVSNAQILAVAARDLSNAQAFATKYHITKAYGSYEQLAADPEIDVVYIGTTHNFHFEHTMLCFKNNKHVLCEKPITVNAAQFKLLTEEAHRRKLFLMEAMWTPFLPPIIKALEWIAQGKIGEVQLIKADLGFVLDSNPKGRQYNPELAGGALLDVGIYPLTMGRIVAQCGVESYHVRARMSKTGIDESNTIQIIYKNGMQGQFASAINARYKNDAFICGTTGMVIISEFHMTRKAILETPKYQETFTDQRDTNGYNYEAQAVTDNLLDKQTQNRMMPWSKSMELLELMDSLRKEIGLKYPFE